MKILLVHADKFPWATQHRAEQFKKRWADDEVTICSKFNMVDGAPYDIIHILFSGGMKSIEDFIIKYKDKTYTTLASQRTMDYVYDSAETLMNIYSQSKGTVVQNPYLLEKLVRLIGEEHRAKLVYIPNGVDTDLFNREFVVGFVGFWKGNVPEHKGFELVQQACKELGLKLLYAHESYEDMPNFYKQIDCLALASISEGCNNPTLEALAMNKPVISTKVGIAGELEGVTIVNRDVESIKRALRKLSGRIQILESYTWDIISRRYRELYVEK